MSGTPLFYDHCALAHVIHKGDIEIVPNEIIYDFKDLELSKKIKLYQDYFCDLLKAIAVLAYALNFNLKQKTVLRFCFVVNLLLSIDKLVSEPTRYGMDYIAYLQQAAAVWNGETNYTKLSSNLGPCYYPAGHIWHYVPAVWLHLYTEHAEIIIKFIHFVVQSLVNCFIAKIAYIYFKGLSVVKNSGDRDAQLLAFTMLASKETRFLHAQMYNDQIMVFYLVVGIY